MLRLTGRRGALVFCEVLFVLWLVFFFAGVKMDGIGGCGCWVRGWRGRSGSVGVCGWVDFLSVGEGVSGGSYEVNNI